MLCIDCRARDRKRKLVSVICEEEGFDQAGLCGSRVRQIDLPLSLTQARPGRHRDPPSRRFSRDARPVRLSARPRHAPARGWGHQRSERTYRIYNEMGLQLRNKTREAPRHG